MTTDHTPLPDEPADMAARIFELEHELQDVRSKLKLAELKAKADDMIDRRLQQLSDGMPLLGAAAKREGAAEALDRARTTFRPSEGKSWRAHLKALAGEERAAYRALTPQLKAVLGQPWKSRGAGK